MRVDGWIFMLLSWGIILGLFGYTMYRTLFSEHSDQALGDDQSKESKG